MIRSLLRAFSGKTSMASGLAHDQEGILSRYARERAGWDPHLAHTKEFILKSVELFAPRRLAVLGSGWLLDVPLDTLAQIPQLEIGLFDLRHPRQITHRWRHKANIAFHEIDLTNGLVGNCAQAAQGHAPAQPLDLIPAALPKIGSYDMAISVNLINQLDILTADYLTDNALYTDEQLQPFRQAVQQKHLEFLSSFPAAALIADCVEHRSNQDTGEQSSHPLVHVPLPAAACTDSWIWAFDHSGMYRDGQHIDFAVQARAWANSPAG